MVQVIGKLSLKMGVLLRGSVYEQKKVRPISQCIHNTGHLSSLLITSIIIRDFRTTFVDGDVTNPEDHPIKNLTYQFEVAFFANFTVMAVVR